jgi:hypothetical protein
MVFLTLTWFEQNAGRNLPLHFSRPKAMKKSHVSRILVHIDVVEDLIFYHFPRKELIADGKVPWHDFAW